METSPNEKKSVVYHTTYYFCPECGVIDFETKQMMWAHSHTWENREQMEICELCKRDKENEGGESDAT